MQAPVRPAKWTVERYNQAVEAGVFADWAVELLAGEIFEMSPEGPLHSGLISAAQDELIDIFAGRAKVRVGHPVTLKRSSPEPDIAIVRLDPGEYLDRHPSNDDILLLIEFSDSSLTLDTRGLKYQIYVDEGIQDYWVVNLKRRVLRVYRDPQDGEYQSQQEWGEGRVSPLALPDVAIDVARLLRRDVV